MLFEAFFQVFVSAMMGINIISTWAVMRRIEISFVFVSRDVGGNRLYSCVTGVDSINDDFIAGLYC
ncbi:hypothetical protein [Endozoicomonas sp.]|uniref:hypothetical protein n=1 Tax=Endozoicomonas sp. TaxID=1892382 RepID=UPI003AF99359